MSINRDKFVEGITNPVLDFPEFDRRFDIKKY